MLKKLLCLSKRFMRNGVWVNMGLPFGRLPWAVGAMTSEPGRDHTLSGLWCTSPLCCPGPAAEEQWKRIDFGLVGLERFASVPHFSILEKPIVFLAPP